MPSPRPPPRTSETNPASALTKENAIHANSARNNQKDGNFEQSQAADAERAVHLIGAPRRERERAAKHGGPPPCDASRRGGQGCGPRRPRAQRLDRHRERRVRGESRGEVFGRTRRFTITAGAQDVQRYSHLSDTAASFTRSWARNSTVWAPAGASSKLIRQPPISGFGCATVLLITP